MLQVFCRKKIPGEYLISEDSCQRHTYHNSSGKKQWSVFWTEWGIWDATDSRKHSETQQKGVQLIICKNLCTECFTVLYINCHIQTKVRCIFTRKNINHTNSIEQINCLFSFLSDNMQCRKRNSILYVHF